MKKLIISLLCSTFITLSFSPLFAQETQQPQEQTFKKPDIFSDSYKSHGFNIRTFLGFGKIWFEGKDKADQKIDTNSDFSIPQFTLLLSYRLFWRLDVGASYTYERFKINSNIIGWKKIKLDEFSINFTFTLFEAEISPYIGYAYTPKISMKDSINAPDSAQTFTLGAKYDLPILNNRFHALFQCSYENFDDVKMEEETKLEISGLRFEFGAGVSI